MYQPVFKNSIAAEECRPVPVCAVPEQGFDPRHTSSAFALAAPSGTLLQNEIVYGPLRCSVPYHTKQLRQVMGAYDIMHPVQDNDVEAMPPK